MVQVVGEIILISLVLNIKIKFRMLITLLMLKTVKQINQVVQVQALMLILLHQEDKEDSEVLESRVLNPNFSYKINL